MNRAYKTNSLRLRQHILSGLRRAFAIQQKISIYFMPGYYKLYLSWLLHGDEDLCASCLKIAKKYANSFGSDSHTLEE